MQNPVTIRIKALFLLVVFSLSSILGFACSIGLNLGYNQHHHTGTQDHAHAITSEHHHTGNDHSHCDSTEAADVPDQDNEPATTHDCCKDGVLKLALSDKDVSTSIKIEAPVQFALDVAVMYFLAAWVPQHVSTIHYYVQSDHPPISSDIRIAIQSFQI